MRKLNQNLITKKVKLKLSKVIHINWYNIIQDNSVIYIPIVLVITISHFGLIITIQGFRFLTNITYIAESKCRK